MSEHPDLQSVAAYNLYKKSAFEVKTRLVLSAQVYWHMLKAVK